MPSQLVDQRRLHGPVRIPLTVLGIQLAIVAGLGFATGTLPWSWNAGGQALYGLGSAMVLYSAAWWASQLVRPVPVARLDGQGVWMRKAHRPWSAFWIGARQRKGWWRLLPWQRLAKLAREFDGEEPATAVRFTDPRGSHRWLVFFHKDLAEDPEEMRDALQDPGQYAGSRAVHQETADAPSTTRTPPAPRTTRARYRQPPHPLGLMAIVGIVVLWIGSAVGPGSVGKSPMFVMPLVAGMMVWTNLGRRANNKAELHVTPTVIRSHGPFTSWEIPWRDVLAAHEVFTNQDRSYVALLCGVEAPPRQMDEHGHRPMHALERLQRETTPPLRVVMATLPETERASDWRLVDTTDLTISHEEVLSLCRRGSAHGAAIRPPQ